MQKSVLKLVLPVAFARPTGKTDLLPFGCPGLIIRCSLPIPTREEIINSPVTDAPPNGATSGYTQPAGQRPPSPIMDDPSAELERELAGASLG